MPVPEKKEQQEEAKKEKKSEDAVPKTKKDAEPSIPSTTEVEPQESAAEASFEPFNNNLWLENFESLMADASLDHPHPSAAEPAEVRPEDFDPWRFYPDVMNMG